MFERMQEGLTITDDQWKNYRDRFHRLEAPSKTILLREGEVAKKLFVIETGAIRACFNQDEKDITFQFFFENDIVSSIESFRKDIPSPVSIETIEASIIWWIHKKDMNCIINEIKDIPQLRDVFIDAIFERTFHYMKHFLSFIKDSPKERYLNLLRLKPQIIQRVPQHYIASYLGISPVHLSRIKSQLNKNK